MVAETFLDLNGYGMNASDEEVVTTMLAVAAGDLREERLPGWFRSSLAKLEERDES